MSGVGCECKGLLCWCRWRTRSIETSLYVFLKHSVTSQRKCSSCTLNYIITNSYLTEYCMTISYTSWWSSDLVGGGIQKSNKSLVKLHQKKLLVICSFLNNDASSKSSIFSRPHFVIFCIFYCKSSERILGTDDLVRYFTTQVVFDVLLYRLVIGWLWPTIAFL